MLEKLKIGERSDLDFSSVVLILSLSSSFKSFFPFAAGLSGSKNPTGFFNDVINSIFNMASSAKYNPAVKPDLGSSERLTAMIFILSISTL